MPFVCETCLARNCSKEEKLEFKTAGEDVLEDVEKFCYLGDMIGCYGGTSEAVSATIGGTWKKFRELSVMLVGKQGLSLKQWVKIYQCSVRPFLWYCRETWELPTVADEARLHGVEPHVIKMMCGVRLVERVLTDVLHDRTGCCCEDRGYDSSKPSRVVMHGDIHSQIREGMEVEITGKKKKEGSREIVGRVHKKRFGAI